MAGSKEFFRRPCGGVAECFFLAHAARLGWIPFVPAADFGGSVDVVIQNDSSKGRGKLVAVQIKSVQYRSCSGLRMLDTRRNSKSYGKSDFDYMAAVEVSTRSVWMLPWPVFHRRIKIAVKGEIDERYEWRKKGPLPA